MMSSMRTTLTLDSDVAKKLKEIAHLKKTSFKETLNSVLRCGLSSGSAGGSDSKFIVKPHKSGLKPGIDPLKLNQLVDQLEVEDFKAEIHRNPK